MFGDEYQSITALHNMREWSTPLLVRERLMYLMY
jgi:hypothetical protein